jgi:hypothetical protein
MRKKKKLIEGKTYWNLYEFRLRGVFLLDIASTGVCERSDIELGRILKCPTKMVANMIQTAVERFEIKVKQDKESRKIYYAA